MVYALSSTQPDAATRSGLNWNLTPRVSAAHAEGEQGRGSDERMDVASSRADSRPTSV